MIIDSISELFSDIRAIYKRERERSSMRLEGGRYARIIRLVIGRTIFDSLQSKIVIGSVYVTSTNIFVQPVQRRWRWTRGTWGDAWQEYDIQEFDAGLLGLLADRGMIERMSKECDTPVTCNTQDGRVWYEIQRKVSASSKQT